MEKDTKQPLVELQKEQEPEKGDPKRWLMLAMYMATLIVSAIIMETFAANVQSVATIYGVEPLVINLTTIFFQVGDLIFTFPSMAAIESGKELGDGAARSFKIAAILTIVAAWGRYLAVAVQENIYWILVPQCLASSALPFLCNGATKMGSIWFTDDDRTIAVSLAGLGIPIGCLIAFGMGPMMVTDAHAKNKTKHYEQGKQKTRDFMLDIAIVATIFCLPLILFYKPRPENPTEFTKKREEALKLAYEDTEEREEQKPSMCTQIRMLICNPSYVALAMTYISIQSVYSGLSTVVNNIARPWYSSQGVGLIGIVFVISGIVGTIVWSIIADMYKKFKTLLVILTVGSLLSGIAAIETLPTSNLTLILINMGFLGSFMIPIAPICGNFAAELTAPQVGEAISYGFMFFIAQICGTTVSTMAVQIITSYKKAGELFEDDGPIWALLTFNTCFLVGTISVCFVRNRSRGEGLKEMTQVEDESEPNNMQRHDS